MVLSPSIAIRRVETGDLTSGVRTAVDMPFGSGRYALVGGRMQRTAGAAVGTWNPLFYEAQAGSDLLTLFYKETFNLVIVAGDWFDITNSATPGTFCRFFDTDKSGKIWINPNQAGGGVDVWRAVLYVAWGFP